MTPPITVHRTESLTVNCREWFSRPDFRQWLNSPDNTIMTWHTKGCEPNEWSDTVVLVDPSLNGEGTDTEMPNDIWTEIVDLCRQQGLFNSETHIPVRLTNI